MVTGKVVVGGRKLYLYLVTSCVCIWLQGVFVFGICIWLQVPVEIG
jgi:hypothetical protein